MSYNNIELLPLSEGDLTICSSEASSKGNIICVMSPYFRGSSLCLYTFRENLHTKNIRTSSYILHNSLFGISDLPTKIQEFPSLFNHSPYLEKKISLFSLSDVSYVCQYYLSRVIKSSYVMKTCPCNVYPLTPPPPTHTHTYSKIGVYRGIHYFLLFSYFCSKT